MANGFSRVESLLYIHKLSFRIGKRFSNAAIYTRLGKRSSKSHPSQNLMNLPNPVSMDELPPLEVVSNGDEDMYNRPPTLQERFPLFAHLAAGGGNDEEVSFQKTPPPAHQNYLSLHQSLIQHDPSHVYFQNKLQTRDRHDRDHHDRDRLPVADDAMESLIKQIASHDEELTLQKIKVNTKYMYRVII